MKLAIIMRTHSEGCNYFRLWLPHKHSMEVEFYSAVPEKIEADGIILHKGYCSTEIITECKKAGIKVILDYDDWIKAPDYHILAKGYNKMTSQFVEWLKLADLVIVTTERLRKSLLVYNKNIEVIPNALNPDELVKYPHKRDKMTFGYMGGKCHQQDLQQFIGLNDRLQKEIPHQYRLALYGYYPDPVKNEYLKIFAGNHRNTIDLYKYVDATKYLEFYNTLDVALIPLIDDEFNSYKSELKMIEAGFYKKACIVSNVMPYKDLIAFGFSKDVDNCLSVDNKYQWAQRIKICVQNPQYVKDVGERLYELVLSRYDLRKWNDYRFEVYRNLLK